MAYNRTSIIPQQQQQQQQSRSRKKEDEADAFMRLPDSEIVGCITEIGINFTIADLQKPNPAHVQQIFEWFAKVLLNATRETVDPAMRAAAEDVCGEFADVIPPDTRNLMGFYASLRQLLVECGVTDLSFNDLYRPTYERLAKIFSYLINFVRFRESQTAVVDEHYNRSEGIKARIEGLHADRAAGEDRLRAAQRRRGAMEAQVAEKTARNEALKQQLLELRRDQERAAARLDEAKQRKTELTGALEARTQERLALRRESAKLRPYVLQSPASLQRHLAELWEALRGSKAQTDGLERRARALQTSSDSLAAVSAEAEACVRILDEVAAELALEEEELARSARQRDALAERGNDARDADRAEALLRDKLAKWLARTARLREQAAQRAAEAGDRLRELSDVHARLTDEQAVRGREMDRRRAHIELTEKKMLNLRENIDKEVRAAHDEYLKMESHIKLYITEMEQAIKQQE